MNKFILWTIRIIFLAMIFYLLWFMIGQTVELYNADKQLDEIEQQVEQIEIEYNEIMKEVANEIEV